MSFPVIVPAVRCPFGLCPSGEDDALIRRAAADPAAFDAFVARHRDGLRGFLIRRLRSSEEADDAVAATFCKAWRARESYRGDAPAKAWLYQIATRVVLDRLRSRRRHPVEELDPLDPALVEAAAIAPDPALLMQEQHDQETLRRSVREAVSGLCEDDRGLVRMFYFEGHSYEGISEQLGINRSQVRGRLHRIRERLRRRLEPDRLA